MSNDYVMTCSGQNTTASSISLHSTRTYIIVKRIPSDLGVRRCACRVFREEIHREGSVCVCVMIRKCIMILLLLLCVCRHIKNTTSVAYGVAVGRRRSLKVIRPARRGDDHPHARATTFTYENREIGTMGTPTTGVGRQVWVRDESRVSHSMGDEQWTSSARIVSIEQCTQYYILLLS